MRALPGLGGLLFGAVAGNFGKANQRAVFRAHSINNHMRPEGAAVFAVAPAFHFITPGAAGGFQPMLREAFSAVLFAVKQREVFPDNFFRQIAFGALCAGIPVGDGAIRLEHINCVIHYALYQ